MDPVWAGHGQELYQCEALDLLGSLGDCSADSVVTDPPYGLEFMSVAWDSFSGGPKGPARTPADWGDHGSREHPRTSEAAARVARNKAHAFEAWCRPWAAECLRVLRPGGYLVAFGGTRTYHRLVCAMEDAGFEIRDSLHWLYGQGWPKSQAALKPGHEPIVLARKPGPPGSGLLQVAASRVGVTRAVPASHSRTKSAISAAGLGVGDRRPDAELDPSMGRWPPNILLTHSAGCEPAGLARVKGSRIDTPSGPTPHSGYGSNLNGPRPVRGVGDADGMETIETWTCAAGCPVAELDRQTAGTRTALPSRTGSNGQPGGNAVYGAQGHSREAASYADQGGASRFYPVSSWTPAEMEFAFAYHRKADAAERPGRVGGDDQAHPTVKPLALMLRLVKLVTPPRGVLVDPFAGTGPALEAAALLRMTGIGCDNWQVAIDSAILRLNDLGGRDRKIRARRSRTPPEGHGTLW